MGFGVVHALVLVPLMVATAAVWVPAPRQIGLLGAGPVLLLVAAAPVPLVERLRPVLLFGVPLALLLVLPVLPWQPRWARWAVPATVLGVCVLLVTLTPGQDAAFVFVAYPLMAAVGALVATAVSSWRRGSWRLQA